MVRYETLFLTIPELTNDEFNTLESGVNTAIQDAKGALISFERWGKYRLSYPVKKHEYGIYGLVRFEVDSASKTALLNELKTLLSIKFGDTVMRTLTISLSPQQSLVYHRPESLEETPGRDVDLLKDKMELFSKKAAPVKAEEEVEESEAEEVEEVEEDRFAGDNKMVAAATPPSEGN